MPGPYTLDASVLLNAFNPREAGYAESHRLLVQLQEAGTPIVVPTLLLPEVAGTISRGRQDAGLARAFVNSLNSLPHVVFVPLDLTAARRAAELAADNRLRGSDAVYASVAVQFGSILVTLDREQKERVAKVLPTRLPSEISGA